MASKKFLCALFAILLGIGGIGQAVALEWEASLKLGEIYTDNVELATDDLAEDEWITRVMPAIDLSHSGQRLELNVDYSLEALFYSDVSERNEAYSQLASLALVDLIGDALRLRGQWDITQANIDPDLPLTGSNINITGNRTDLTSWRVGPEWRQELGGASVVDAFYRFGKIDYDDPSLQDVDTRRGAFVLRSNPDTRSTMTYELGYTNDLLLYDVSPDIEIQSAYLQLGYRVRPSLRLTALGGLDNDYTDLTDSSLSEARWEVGLDAEINEDLIKIGVGSRFYGTTYRFSWNRDQDDKTFRVSYSDGPSTVGLVGLRQKAPEEGEPLPPDSDLSRPGIGESFIFRRANAGVQWRLFRSTVDASLFWENREGGQTTLDPGGNAGIVTSDDVSFGAVIALKWELGLKTIAKLRSSWRRREVVPVDAAPGTPDTISEDDIYSVSAGLSYHFGDKTSLSLDTAFKSRDSASGRVSSYDQFLARLEFTRKL